MKILRVVWMNSGMEVHTIQDALAKEVQIMDVGKVSIDGRRKDLYLELLSPFMEKEFIWIPKVI